MLFLNTSTSPSFFDKSEIEASSCLSRSATSSLKNVPKSFPAPWAFMTELPLVSRLIETPLEISRARLVSSPLYFKPLTSPFASFVTSNGGSVVFDPPKMTGVVGVHCVDDRADFLLKFGLVCLIFGIGQRTRVVDGNDNVADVVH